MPLNQNYEVKLDLFEGPLDLLLYLVVKDEVDIAQISVARVAEQYLAYLDLIRELNINVAAEYLHMAATLVRLKARELLPAAEPVVTEEGEGIYSREQLVAQLLEYKKFKEAAHSLRQYESAQAGSFARGVPDEMEGDMQPEEESLGSVSTFDLITAFRRILERAKEQEPGRVVQPEQVRLDDRVEAILVRLGEFEEVPFEELFGDDRRRIVLVVTFMALLELVKMQEVVFRQEGNFETIFVARRKQADREPGAQPPEEPTGQEPQS